MKANLLCAPAYPLCRVAVCNLALLKISRYIRLFRKDITRLEVDGTIRAEEKLRMGDQTMSLATDKPSAIAAGLKIVSHKKRPDFFIVGAPKCGTTALNHYLAAHPDVYFAKKEMHYFGSDLRFGPQFYRRDQKAYLAEFAACNSQACVGEASVWYLFSHQAAVEIKAFNPDARIIIQLREPVAMLYSLYHQFRADGNEHLPTFKEALAAEDDRRAGRRITRQTYFVQGLVYRAAARYTEQVRRYFDAFGRERVHVVIYDDFAADPAGAYRDALKFLGLDSSHADINFRVINGSQSVRSPALRAFLNDPLVRGSAIALRSWLPHSAFTMLQKAGDRLGQFNTRLEKRPPLAPDLHLSLRCEFAPEVERLSALLGRDLSHWSNPQPPAVGPLSHPASRPDEAVYLPSSETPHHSGGSFV